MRTSESLLGMFIKYAGGDAGIYPLLFPASPLPRKTRGAYMSEKNDTPTQEQRKMLERLITCKLPKMTIGELQELYAATTKIMDRRKAAQNA